MPRSLFQTIQARTLLLILHRSVHDTYGEVYGTTGSSQTDFGFTGEQTDPNTGLVYLRNRYYNPTLGVFPSLDPLEGNMANPLSLNRYAYVLDNPVNFVDPSGLTAIPGCLDRLVERQLALQSSCSLN
jgi:RHS repeat-associated protein